MTFQPVLPLSGYAGWLFLDRTLDSQREAFNASPILERETDYFRENIGSIQTAEELVNDRRLLSVALGAFGLGEDINNKAFIQKVLEGASGDPDALANRLSDSRYRNLSDAFGFGEALPPRTVFSFLADDIIDRYKAQEFQVAVGNQNNDMRLALNLETALDDVLDTNSTNNGQWFAMMGNPALRTMFDTALGFPSSFAAIDLDQQLDQFQARARATFGTDEMSQIADPDNQEKLIRLYLIRSEANAAAATSSSSVALSLLQQIRF